MKRFGKQQDHEPSPGPPHESGPAPEEAQVVPVFRSPQLPMASASPQAAMQGTGSPAINLVCLSAEGKAALLFFLPLCGSYCT